MSTVLKPIPASGVRHEALRIDGQRVWRDAVIDVYNPYDGSLVGTVPKATL
ncbi:MAG: phosphonoacetaldehyde dehydrogenase, partial [Burkholderia sp.]|nr:phosphonoacetaldehyde dehydrogenase [Burkholderia sp.]